LLFSAIILVRVNKKWLLYKVKRKSQVIGKRKKLSNRYDSAWKEIIKQLYQFGFARETIRFILRFFELVIRLPEMYNDLRKKVLYELWTLTGDKIRQNHLHMEQEDSIESALEYHNQLRRAVGKEQITLEKTDLPPGEVKKER